MDQNHHPGCPDISTNPPESMDLRFKLSRARPSGPTGPFSLLGLKLPKLTQNGVKFITPAVPGLPGAISENLLFWEVFWEPCRDPLRVGF